MLAKRDLPNHDQAIKQTENIFKAVDKSEKMDLSIIESTARDLVGAQGRDAYEIYVFLQEVYAQKYNAIADIFKMLLVYPRVSVDEKLFHQFHQHATHYLYEGKAPEDRKKYQVAK